MVVRVSLVVSALVEGIEVVVMGEMAVTKTKGSAASCSQSMVAVASGMQAG